MSLKLKNTFHSLHSFRGFGVDFSGSARYNKKSWAKHSSKAVEIHCEKSRKSQRSTGRPITPFKAFHFLPSGPQKIVESFQPVPAYLSEQGIVKGGPQKTTSLTIVFLIARLRSTEKCTLRRRTACS